MLKMISFMSYFTPWKLLTRSLSSSDNPMTLKRYPWTQHFRVSKARCYFPRPNENMRIKKHGWRYRMTTEGGRKVIMNRILKGRHVLSH